MRQILLDILRISDHASIEGIQQALHLDLNTSRGLMNSLIDFDCVTEADGLFQITGFGTEILTRFTDTQPLQISGLVPAKQAIPAQSVPRMLSNSKKRLDSRTVIMRQIEEEKRLRGESVETIDPMDLFR